MKKNNLNLACLAVVLLIAASSAHADDAVKQQILKLFPQADANKDGVIDDNDKATDVGGNTDTIAAIRQEGFLPEPVFIEDIAFTAETPSKVIELDDIPTGRFSWQELLQ